jgi:hypothetical protein
MDPAHEPRQDRHIKHFSPNVRDVFDGFRMMNQIAELAKSDRLYLIVKEFAAVHKRVGGAERATRTS